jgi:hypothetical protein
VTFAWTAVAGAQASLFEHTGPDLAFTNPLGTAPDPINGIARRGNSLRVSGTSLTLSLSQDLFTPDVLPLARNLTVSAPFQSTIFTASLPVGLLSGRYLFFAVMVRPGTSPRDSGTFLSILATKEARIL